jgi:hypothetical protein
MLISCKIPCYQPSPVLLPLGGNKITSPEVGGDSGLLPMRLTLQIRSGQRTQGRIRDLCSRLLHLVVGRTITGQVKTEYKSL